MRIARRGWTGTARAVAACALVLWPGAAGASPGGWSPGRAAVAMGAELAAEGGRIRLTLSLSRPVSVTTFVLERPDRVVIDLPEVNLQLGPEAGRRRSGLVSALRGGLVGPGRSRIVLDLAGPAAVTRAEVTDGPLPDVPMLVVELVRTDRDAFRRAAASGNADLVLTTGSIEPRRDRDTRPAIALDAGHGGIDPGARAANGALEKDITLAFVEELRTRLEAGGRYRIVATREGDVFVPLDERVKKARHAGAALFVSIHADTISNRHVTGATLYTGSDRATDAESASLAERENAADAAGGIANAPLPGEVADILHDLTLRETRGFSHRFSSGLLRDLGQVLRFSPHPQREAGFRVLRSPDLPSVLVELGYLSNARDLDLMQSADWRRRTAAAMAKAVDRFFADRVASARAPMSP